jgi:hypothetical protein
VSPGSINFSHTPFDGPTVVFLYDGLVLSDLAWDEQEGFPTGGSFGGRL